MVVMFNEASILAQFVGYRFDLEDGYSSLATGRIHLYADENRWAVVTESSGYNPRALRAEMSLEYFGNCGDAGRTKMVTLIDGDEWIRIRLEDEDDFNDERIDPSVVSVRIREQDTPLSPAGMEFQDVLRYFADNTPELIWATEKELREHIPSDIPKLMTIDEFHYVSVYSDGHDPENIEMFQLIAKVLVSRDVAQWAPTLPPNSHWSNWNSGHL